MTTTEHNEKRHPEVPGTTQPVVGFAGVRYQVKDVQRAIVFTRGRLGSIWTCTTRPPLVRFQPAVSSSF